jgi:site-specific DNA-cytosine methylase
MRVLSLFSGIGAHDAGLQAAGHTIVGQCEIDPFACAVLEKHWPGLPRYTDVRDITADSVRQRCGDIDLITGGFPCTDISVAGKGAGLEGKQSGLWFEMLRVIRAVRPAICLIENVPALRSRGADRVFADLEEAGYAPWPCVVGAWAVGAPHKRDRVWIVAYAARDGEPEQPARERSERVRVGEAGGAVVGYADGGHDDGRASRKSQRLSNAHGTGHCVFPGGCWRCGNELANTESSGRATEGERRQPQLAGIGATVSDVADASVEGLEGRRALSGGTVAELAMPAGGGGYRWPARPGEPQHDWEAPRLVEFEVGGTASTATARLVRASNRNALRCLGAANPPVVPYLIGLWLASTPKEHQ